MARHRCRNAEERGACRVPAGGPSTRPRYAVGVSDGWHERLAADIAGRPPRRVPLARRRTLVEAAGPGPAEGAGVVDGQAPGDERRLARTRGTVFRHDLRRSLGQPGRGPDLSVPGAAPAAH